MTTIQLHISDWIAEIIARQSNARIVWKFGVSLISSARGSKRCGDCMAAVVSRFTVVSIWFILATLYLTFLFY